MEHPLTQFIYCPVCASPQFHIVNDKAKKCAECRFTYYFNPSSATVCLITNDNNELLVARRGKEPAKGTLDLPGGFVDMFETVEEGARREVLEETGLVVNDLKYLFSLPNIYVYSGFPVHTVDMFFRCRVDDTSQIKAMDDVSDTYFMPLKDIDPEAFGLTSVRKGLKRFLREEGIDVPESEKD